MIKKLILLFIILITIPSFGQKKDLFLDIKGGAIFPLGKFSELSLDGGSFATTGIGGKIDLSWFLFDDIGFRFGFSGAMVPVNAIALATEKVEQDPFMQDLTIRTDAYTYMNIFASVLYRKHLSENWKLYGYLGAGMIYMETPYQLHKPQYFMTGPAFYEITAAGDYAVMFHIGSELEYRIVNQWSIIAGFSFNYANMQFTFIHTDETVRLDRRKVLTLESNIGIRLYF